MSRLLRVVVADDALMTRSAIRELLGGLAGIELVAEHADGDALLAALTNDAPDVVISDLRMPPGGDGEGIRIAATLRETHPAVGVLVLSQHEEPSFARALLEGDATGRGYLLKDGLRDRGQLEAAIRVVSSGGTVIDPGMVRRLMVADERRGGPLRELTTRELEVLSWMAEGESNGAIAARLRLSKRAIEKHITAIFSKLELPDEDVVSRRVSAVLLYLEGVRPDGRDRRRGG